MIKIMILGGRGISTNIVYNYLKRYFDIKCVIIEDKVPLNKFLKRRIKKMGYGKVAGQILFKLFVSKPLSKFSKKRIRQIMEEYDIDDAPIDEQTVRRVKSVNDKEVRFIIDKVKPDVIVINGTRILSKKLLDSTDIKFINTHAGITPAYRGVHGGYWALTDKKPENFGVTVHLVDAGIDTGGILYQKNIRISRADNFSTYPLLQLAEALPFLKKAIEDVYNNNIRIIKADKSSSKLWSHPTIYDYLFNRLINKVK